VPPFPRRRIHPDVAAAAAVTGAVVLALALLGLAAFARPAAAAFAGRNGDVSYDGRWSARGLLSLRRPDGSRLRQIRAPGRPMDPAFSPLGRRIAFVTNGQVWVMYSDGSGQRPVTSGTLPGRDPAWSPNGEQLVFAGGARGARDIYEVNADGFGLRRLTRKPVEETAPAWSVRGRIVFVRRTARGDGDLRTMSPAGGATGRLTHGKANDQDPAWSPDGRQLAFTRGTSARRDVWRVGADGHHARRLTTLSQGASSPAWSPDGRSIAFSMGRAGRRALYVVPSGGGRARRVSPTTADAATLDWQATGADPVIAAAGDIACDPADEGFNRGAGIATECHQRQTSDVLLKMDLSAVLALGDTQYESGAGSAFGAFDATWGRVRSLIRPVVGNHESRDPGAAGYYDYFDGPGAADGPAGPRGQGWYSWDLGSWHLVALNSQCSWPTVSPTLTDCAAGSPQEQWLRADLAAHRSSRCTLVYFHHPLTSSGVEQFNVAVQPFWRDLQAANVDVVLTGHDHAYERFAPLDAQGRPDRAHGVRQFVVGTGGKNFTILDYHKAGSQLRQSSVFGVLQMTLRRGSYHWRFVPEAGGGFTDEGDASCR
jgi:hypothetical protein